jgi:hypothetical protein
MKWMTRLSTAIALGAALVVTIPAAADQVERTAASGLAAADDRWDDDDDRRNRHDRRDRDRGRRGDRHRGRGNDAPAFCRSGEGHPVFGMSWCHGNRKGPAFCRTGEGHPRFGMRWCYEKGFGPGAARWRQHDPGDIVFERWPRRRAERRTVSEGVLDDILGDLIFGRLVSRRDRIGLDRDLEGRWYTPDGRSSPRVLQVRAGGLPLAEFIDLDGDGRVDLALVLEP